jgi:hypothetical protein
VANDGELTEVPEATLDVAAAGLLDEVSVVLVPLLARLAELSSKSLGPVVNSVFFTMDPPWDGVIPDSGTCGLTAGLGLR